MTIIVFEVGQNKINCIKAVRTCFGLSLSESKNVVEAEAVKVTKLQSYALCWCLQTFGLKPEKFIKFHTPTVMDLTDYSGEELNHD